MQRRTFLRSSGAALLGAAVTSCLPVKYVTGFIPASFKTRTAEAEETALRFAATIIPDPDAVRSEVVDPLWDTYYPFYEFCPLFLDLLHTEAQSLTGVSFIHCTAKEREQVVASILDNAGTGAQLVQGAIMAIQCTFYAGTFDSDNGCPSIGFHGSSGVGQGLPSYKPTLSIPPKSMARNNIN